MTTRKTHHRLESAERNELPAREFAFPAQRKEPLEDAAHVRNAIARFHQVSGVTQLERDAAWQRIKRAAARFGVEMNPHDG
jgi:hypothetical protein